MSHATLVNIIDELENRYGDDPQTRRLLKEARSAAFEVANDGHPKDPYFERVEGFHRAVREESSADYLSVRTDLVLEGGTPLDQFREVPDEARRQYARVVAERNRLFWATFLNEEAGEVADALSSGQPPDDFKYEVVDVMVVCLAIFECFGWDPLEAFHEVMNENDKKPKRQEGTGKLPAEARDAWEREAE